MEKYVSGLSGSLRLFWLALILGITGTSFGQKQGPKSPWFFIQISDPQLGMFNNNASFEKETILYETAVNKINKLNPDFVVITGDFVHNPNSTSQIEDFKRITSKINSKISLYYMQGNHDVGKSHNKTSVNKYKKNYESVKFSFDHKDSSFTGINSGFIMANLADP